MTFNQIDKIAPVLNYVSLWKDASSTTFYAYGGEVSGISQGGTRLISPNGLWQFTPSGHRGSWSQVGISSSSIFPSLTRQAGAAGTSGDGAGYLLGGYNAFVPIPGIVTYNMSSGVWGNNSAAGFSTYGTAEYGQMQYVPNVAENGLLVLFGGETSDDVLWHDNGSDLLSFGIIYMYDISSNTWHNQTASGTIPQSRDRFCSVGVQGDNGTFEIFIMGGHVASPSGEPQASGTDTEKQQNIALDEVFVLSLPSFNWQKADYTPSHPRVDHSCNVIGNRQMVVIGGVNPASDNGTALSETPDIWDNGIGVFEMTKMVWNERYNASAAEYVTPKVVKSWIKQNGPYPSTWDDATVEGFFVRSSKYNLSTLYWSYNIHLLTSHLATSTNSTSSPSGTSSPSSSASSSSSKSSSNAGAIAGGVVGGIALLAIIGGLVWFFLRRRRQSVPRQNHSLHSIEAVPEKSASPLVAQSELPAGYDSGPLAAKSGQYQGAAHEMPTRGDGARHEMQG